MQEERKNRFSAGTRIMLALTLAVLALSAFVLIRLSSGTGSGGSGSSSALPAAGQDSAQAVEEIRPGPAPQGDALSAARTENEGPEAKPREATLTLAGTVALDGEVRKNSYFSDVKQYDYLDNLALVRKEIRSDINIVFLENILTDEAKATDVKADESAADMLYAGGFRFAACGFSRAFDQGGEGILQTREILKRRGIEAIGIRESGSGSAGYIQEANGIRIAVVQLTGTIPAATRKSMNKQGMADAVPSADAETAAREIAAAREQGCDAVVVLLNWGKTGKAPDKAQRSLARQIADAGADLIAGCGSRIVSGAEEITAGDGRRVLCIWSLGTLLSGDRSNIQRIAGIAVHATVRSENGKTAIGNFSYTPVYTWKYKMDGRFYYRSLAANGSIPDGMDNEQQKYMKKALDTVRSAMKDAPMEERGSE